MRSDDSVFQIFVDPAQIADAISHLILVIVDWTVFHPILGICRDVLHVRAVRSD
jgi:hypothetical protein